MHELKLPPKLSIERDNRPVRFFPTVDSAAYIQLVSGTAQIGGCRFTRPSWAYPAPDYQPDSNAKTRQHVDQSIGAKQIDATAKKIADAGLCDAKHLRRFYLLKTPRRDSFLNLNQQVSTNEQML